MPNFHDQHEPPMVGIAEWLDSLNLREYTEVFAAEKIDLSVITELHDQDLQTLGIPLGPRKKILRAIEDIRLGKVPRPDRPRGTFSSRQQDISPAAAERRQLTVMFCDLVGSTALSGKMDPEEYREVLTTYRSSVVSRVRKYDGYVAGYMGDGLLVYFGYPQAHEDDPERAVRSGLEIVNAFAQLVTAGKVKLKVRVGIATGLVVAGDLVVTGASEERAVLGDTPNLASRLQTMAGENEVLISEKTRELVKERFVLDEIGRLTLKGIEKPILAYRVVTIADTTSNQSNATRFNTGFSGRESELTLLMDRWHKASLGEGQVVFIGGEPGIGKSRLVDELWARIGSEIAEVVHVQCSPYHTGSALFPVIQHLQRLVGFTQDDRSSARITKLKNFVKDTWPEGTAALPLLASLLSINTENYSSPELPPEDQRAGTIALLLHLIENHAAKGPVLIAFEDAHWIDPSTQEFMDVIIQHSQNLRILCLITHRPEYSSQWITLGHVTGLSLSRLGRAEIARLVQGVTAGKEIPSNLLSLIAERADGVPLFAEELTKSVLESDLLTESEDRFDFLDPLTPFAIPSTLQDSLMARLDRLGDAKEIAQICSVIGRTFSYELLGSILPDSLDKIDSGLKQLIDSGLVYRNVSQLYKSYAFKHALVRDTAYQSILRKTRQRIHEGIATVLKAKFPEIAESEPEVLAWHEIEAGRLTDAIGSLEGAGNRAAKRSAAKEAARHYSKALELLAVVPDERRAERELALRTGLGPALIATLGFGSSEVGINYLRAQQLSEEVGDVRAQFSTLWGSWVFHTVRAEMQRANELGETLLDIATRAQDADLQLQAHHALETSLFWSGRFEEALKHMDAVQAAYDAERHGSHAAQFGGHDPQVCCLSFRSLTMWICGKVDLANSYNEQAFALCDQLGQPGSTAHVQQLSLKLDMFRRDADAAAKNANALIKLAAKHGFRQSITIAKVAEAWAAAMLGGGNKAISQMEKGIDLLDQMGTRASLSLYFTLLAELLYEADRPMEAEDYLQRAADHCSAKGERFFEAEMWVVRGYCRTQHGEHALAADAENCFVKALDIAGRQGARSWELRAANRLAQLWLERGRKRDAHLLLDRVLAPFGEHDESRDLSDARRLQSLYN